MGEEIVKHVEGAVAEHIGAAAAKQAPKAFETIATSPTLIAMVIGVVGALVGYAIHQGYGFSRTDPDGTVYRFGPQIEKGVSGHLTAVSCV